MRPPKAQLSFFMSVLLPSLLISATAAADPDLLSLASSAQDFDGVCKILGPFLPFPVVKSDKFCATTGFDRDLLTCPFLVLTEKGLPRLSGGTPSSICLGANQSPAAHESLTGWYLAV